jgi:alpha-amylase
MKRVFSILLMTLVVLVGVSCGSSSGDSIAYENDDKVIDPGQQMTSGDDWYKSSVFYHIWVRAWSDGQHDDGIGDIRGIINNLDYLNDGNPATTTDLGVNAIWLSPIFECSYKGENMHGYDTTDFYAINNRFGKSSDIKELLEKAHDRGIRVIFDFVPNHTSPAHPWITANPAFYKRSASQLSWPLAWDSGDYSGTRWYRIGSWYYYSAFNTGGIVDLDYMNGWDGSTSPVMEEMKNAAKYWLDRGFDGMRVDAVRYMVEDGPGLQADRPATHDVLKQFRALLDTYSVTGSSKMMVGEAWTATSVIKDYYGNGSDEFQMCFDFGFPYNIRDSINAGSNSAYVGYLNTVKGLSFPGPLSVFSVNHDNVVSRAATLYSNNRKQCIVSAALNIFGNGVPFIYYGEEVGMTGASGDDINLRQNFPWGAVASQGADAHSILNWYRYLIRARLGNKAIREGGTTAYAGGNSAMLYLVKDWGDQFVLIAINLSGATVTDSVDLTAAGALVSNNAVTSIIGDLGGVTALAGKTMNINSIPAYGMRVVLLQNDSSFTADDVETGIFAADLQ